MKSPHWYGAHYVAPLVRYCLLLDEKQYLRECKKLNIRAPSHFVSEGARATTHFFDGDRNVTAAIVCLSLPMVEGHTISELNAILVHEATHVYQEMMDKMREEAPGKEIEAYYIQRISLDLMGELDNYFKENPHAHPDHRKHD